MTWWWCSVNCVKCGKAKKLATNNHLKVFQAKAKKTCFSCMDKSYYVAQIIDLTEELYTVPEEPEDQEGARDQGLVESKVDAKHEG